MIPLEIVIQIRYKDGRCNNGTIRIDEDLMDAMPDKTLYIVDKLYPFIRAMLKPKEE